jgi:hypothetical protein
MTHELLNTLLLQVNDEIHSGALFTCLKFSLDGSLLLAVAEGRMYILEAFDGRPMQKVGSSGLPVNNRTAGGGAVQLLWRGTLR